MAINVEQLNFGLDKLFKRAKKFCSQSKNNGVNPNTDGFSNKRQKRCLHCQQESIKLSSPALGKFSKESTRKISNEPNIQTSVMNQLKDLEKRSKSKDVNEILVPNAVNPEIRSENVSLQGVKNSPNSMEHSKPEICRAYALTKTWNSDKLTEIINNSIKAAVQNLTVDTNPTCSRKEQEPKNVTPIESSCLNDTCTIRVKSSQNKENVTNSTQYSQQAISNVKPSVSGNICSIYANNGSKRSYNSHQKSSPHPPPTCCIPSLKSGISSVICHRSVSKYEQIMCPCVKKKPDKLSKPCKPCKPCKPYRHLKTDNRKMTGNVNIYICSEGNDGGNKKKKKKKTSESTCNSMTVTNASCTCSSTDVCAFQSTSSAKTIRDLMGKRKKAEDITLKCACGKLPSECECLPVQSKNEETETVCLCDMSSLNHTASNETCRDAIEYNPLAPNNSGSSPQGDYCTRRIRSKVSSQHESYCPPRNFDTVNGMSDPENSSEIYVEKSKFTTGNKGRGDAVQECSCCDTLSNYSESKFNVCGCCNVNDVINSLPWNQRERYVPQNNLIYSRRDDDNCNCCTCEKETLYSCGRISDIDRSVCCQNKNLSKPQARPKMKDYCSKPCDTPRNSICNGSKRRLPRYSNFCIMEEDETYDAATYQSPCLEQKNLNGSSSFQADSKRCCKRNSDVHKAKAGSIEQEEPINGWKKDDAVIVTSNDVPAAQADTGNTKMSVAEIAKFSSNANKSTASNMITPINSIPPVSSSVKNKSAVQSNKSLEKEPRSSLKWPFSKGKILSNGKNTHVESKRDKVQTDNKRPKSNVIPTGSGNTGSVSSEITKNPRNVLKKSMNSINSGSNTKGAADKNSLSVIKSSAEKDLFFSVQNLIDGELKSKELIIENNKTKLSSSRLGSLIAERKNSIQTAANETAHSQIGNPLKVDCSFEDADTDVYTYQYPRCFCCKGSREDCNCKIVKDRSQEQSCKGCKEIKLLCCCCDVSDQQKKYRTIPEDGGFRVCTLCCRPETDCCCNLGGQTPGRSISPSISYNNTEECYETVCRKSQICLYCEEPRDKCICRAPIKKCSYCGMPVDVCNCQDVTDTCNTCCYNDNICQCNGRVIQNSDGGDQSICVTAWKPRRDVRKYFSRNPGEKDNPDCPCCDTIKPYGSDELPYQRLRVFSDVMSELQQKMSDLTCCNRCGKTPCCCYLQESQSYLSPTNEGTICNTKQRKSRSRSPPCHHCLGTSPCKCKGRKTPLYQICSRCITTPCRCRKSRSTQRKPQAKCYYCKCTPCRCESSKETATTPKSCKCNVSPSRSQGQDSPFTDRSPDRNSPSFQARNCCCRCGSPSCGSPPRGQERSRS